MDSIIETLTQKKDYTIFLDALTITGLDKMLSTKGPFTIFAPSDQAFRKLDTTSITYLNAHPQALASLIKHHILLGTYSSHDLSTCTTVKTIDGNQLSIRVIHSPKEELFVNDIPIIEKDIHSTNATIYRIDQVLCQPLAS